MSEKVVKLGVVGLGRGIIASLIIGQKNVKLTAICDRNPEKLKEVKEKLSERVEDLQAYDNFEDLLKSDIDAVLIATDANCHVPYVIKALEAGKHVLSEIPAVTNLEEAKLLKEAVKAHPHLKYMCAENCCYWSFIQAWKKMYDDGKFGQAIYAESEYIHSKDYREMKAEDYPADHWRAYEPAIKYVTHNLGPLLYIMDDRCVSVTCMEPEVEYNPYRKPNHNAVALFKTAKGAVIRIFICFDAFVDFDHNFALIGTRGTIETDKVKRLDEAHSYARFSDIPGSIKEKVHIPVALALPGESTEGHGGADIKMILDFINCIINDTEPPIDVDMGIRMTIPGIIAAESAKQGGAPLEIPEI